MDPKQIINLPESLNIDQAQFRLTNICPNIPKNDDAIPLAQQITTHVQFNDILPSTQIGDGRVPNTQPPTPASNLTTISPQTAIPYSTTILTSVSSSSCTSSSYERDLTIGPVLDSDNSDNIDEHGKKSLSFGTVTIYHFTRSQGFSSIPSQGGSTLGMTRKHFRREKLSVNLFEEVRRRSRREILLKIRNEKLKMRKETRRLCSPISSSASTSSNIEVSPTSTSSSSSTSVPSTSDSDQDSQSDYSDISDSELESDFSFIFCQPINVKVRRSLLRASGVGRIDPTEKWECKSIRESRERAGCRCINECIPGSCECTLLGVNCHVDRISFPCGCISESCRNPLGRTEYDIKRVKGHQLEKLLKSGIG